MKGKKITRKKSTQKKEIELIEKIKNLNSIGEKKLAEISKNQFLRTKHFYSHKKFSEELRKNIIY